MQNPNSVLAQVPQPEFTSRYADPNHAAASGSLISFVSGGKLIPGPNSRGLIGGLASVVGQAARGERQGSEWERYAAENTQTQKTPKREKQGIIATPIRTYKKLLAKASLSLCIDCCSANTQAECVVSHGRQYAVGGKDDGRESGSEGLRNSLAVYLAYEVMEIMLPIVYSSH